MDVAFPPRGPRDAPALHQGVATFDPDTAPVGGKARALAALASAGLPVPPYFVVLPDAFRASLGDRGREALANARSDEEVAVVAGDASPSPDVRARILDALHTLCPDGAPVAVRSSASDEDGAAHSFAGQLETFLFVDRETLADRVAAVWRSGFSARVLAYRRTHGLSPLPSPPAVIVQRMIDATVSGVAFSADPVAGRRGVAVVSAVWGLGTGIVSGECDADTWHVDRSGVIVSRAIASKTTAHRPDARQPEGVRADPVPPDQVARPALDDAQVVEVAALAREAERYFTRPQDIEWAYEGARLHLLQSRPITSIAALADPDAPLVIWDNSNIVESYSGVTTPMTFSFASAIYEHVYREFCRMMGVSAREIVRHDQTFRNMLGLVRGRLYYNLLNWYRVLALLPGFAVNRRFMEQMMGVRDELPEAVVRTIAPPGAMARLVDAGRLARSLAGLLLHHVTIDRRVRTFYERLDRALAPPQPPLAERRPDELAAHYRDLSDRLLLHWDAPLVNDFFAMIFYGLLRKVTQTWCGDEAGTLQNDLIGGEGGLVSAEPAVRLKRLAALAREDAAFVALLATGSRGAIERAIEQRPLFAAEYRAYLDKFGERSINELKLETETLLDDPIPLLRAVGNLARQPLDGVTAEAGTGERLRAEAERRVADALAARPIRRAAFGWILRHARKRVRDRENLRLERTRLFGRVRRIFLEIGARLAATGAIDRPRDIFYLQVDEVLAFVDGRAVTTRLRELIEVRRREFDEFERMPPPADRFETRGVVYQGHTFQREAADEAVTGDERRGIGCCPGLVRGPVRVVRDPRTVDLDRRAILVAEHTDPGWIMIFPSAMGVLVERGSLLSHAAIVARELGIPAVVSIPGLTRWLHDGDWVELDGAAGRVRRIDQPGADEAGRA